MTNWRETQSAQVCVYDVVCVTHRTAQYPVINDSIAIVAGFTTYWLILGQERGYVGKSKQPFEEGSFKSFPHFVE